MLAIDAKKKSILIMIIALFLGMMASMAFVRTLARNKGSTKVVPQRKIEMDKVVIAVKDLPLGKVVDKEDIQQVTWPKKLISRTTFSQEKDLIGKVVKATIFAGEAITSQRLAIEGSSKGLGVLIPPGMRAMTVEVNEELGASGFIHTGTKVDIIATARIRGEDRFTKLVLQDIEVITVAGEEGSSRSTPKTIITFAINPEDAEKLALALNEGKIHLVVRNALDKEEVMTAGVNTQQLLKVKSPRTGEETKGIKREIKVVELILGEERKEEKFQR